MPLAIYSEQRRRPLVAGQILYPNAPNDIITRLVGGGVAQVTTVQVTAVTNSAVHNLDITYGAVTVQVSFTGDGSATVNEVAAGLEAAIDAEPELGGLLVASVSTDTITLTGRLPEAVFTVAVGSNGNLTASINNTTAAASATAIPFGRAVVQRASYPDECILPSTANDTLEIWEATPVAENAIIYQLSVSFDLDGKGLRSYPFAYTSDGSATVAEIIAALVAGLNAALPANSVLVADATTKITLTSEVPNLTFTVSGWEAGTTSTWTITKATSAVPLRFLGVSCQTHTVEQNASGVGEYSGGDPVSIMRSGVIAVELDAGITPSVGDQVWCRCSASGSEVLGAFRDAQDAADCINLTPYASWVDDSAYTVGNVRVAKLRLLGNAAI